jgi:enoyl-CoA hydratase
MDKVITTQTLDGLFIVTLNSPEKKNAVNGETALALYKAFKSFDADDTLNVAILTGANNTFCAGADLKALANDQSANPVYEEGDFGPMGISRLRLSKPVIAAIEGHAVAGGLELALWCDLRVVADDATLGVFCRRFGVPLVDLGTVRLPRLIGQSRAMDLILTGRPIGADEAFEIGLANRICDKGQALHEAVKLAKLISNFPQECMRNDRSSVLEQWGMSEEYAMKNEFRHGLKTLKSGETLKGATRFKDGAGRHGGFDH